MGISCLGTYQVLLVRPYLESVGLRTGTVFLAMRKERTFELLAFDDYCLLSLLYSRNESGSIRTAAESYGYLTGY